MGNACSPAPSGEKFIEKSHGGKLKNIIKTEPRYLELIKEMESMEK